MAKNCDKNFECTSKLKILSRLMRQEHWIPRWLVCNQKRTQLNSTASAKFVLVTLEEPPVAESEGPVLCRNAFKKTNDGMFLLLWWHMLPNGLIREKTAMCFIGFIVVLFPAHASTCLTLLLDQKIDAHTQRHGSLMCFYANNFGAVIICGFKYMFSSKKGQ